MTSRARVLSLAGVLVLTITAAGRAQPPQLDRHGQPLPSGAVARFGTTQFRHPGRISFLGFVGGSGQLLTGSNNGDLRLWELSQGKESRRWTLPTPAPFDFGADRAALLALSGDGKVLACRDTAQGIVIADTVSGKELRKLTQEVVEDQAKHSIAGFSLSRDGQLLIVSDSNGSRLNGKQVSVWRVATGQLVGVMTAGADMTLTATCLSPDGTTLATLEYANEKDGKENRQLRLWNVADGKEIRSLNLDKNPSRSVQFLPGNKTLALVAEKGESIQLIDAVTGKEVRVFSAKADADLRQVLTSPDGKLLAGVGSLQVFLWDAATGKQLRQFPREDSPKENNPFGRTEQAAPVALSPDGKTLAIGSGVGFRLWDVATGTERAQPEGHRDFIATLAFSPKVGQLLTATPNAPLLLWETTTGKPVRAFAFPVEAAQQMPLTPSDLMLKRNRIQAAFAPDGKTVTGLIRGQPLRRWDAATGQPLNWPTESKPLNSFAYAPDGRHLALDSQDGTIRLVHPATGKLLQQFTWAAPSAQPDNAEFKMQSAFAAFTADSRTLIVAGFSVRGNGMDAGVHLFEMATGQRRLKFDTRIDIGTTGPGDLETIASAMDMMIIRTTSSPDGRHLAAAGLSAIRLWDMAPGREARIFGGHGVVPWTAAFAPGGKLLLAGRQDGSIRVWDVATSAVLADLPAHAAGITALAFSPDGNWLATGSADTTALLWDWAILRKRVGEKKSAPPAKLEALWQDLGSADGERGYRAVLALTATPAETVAFLKTRLKPVPPTDPARLEKLLADLDSKQFNARQAAMQELERLGDLAAAALQQRLTAKPPLEVQRRLEALVAKLEGPVTAPDLIRQLRAVEVLQAIGTPAARQVLEALARGAPGHRLTEDAAASVRRLAKAAE